MTSVGTLQKRQEPIDRALARELAEIVGHVWSTASLTIENDAAGTPQLSISGPPESRLRFGATLELCDMAIALIDLVAEAGHTPRRPRLSQNRVVRVRQGHFHGLQRHPLFRNQKCSNPPAPAPRGLHMPQRALGWRRSRVGYARWAPRGRRLGARLRAQVVAERPFDNVQLPGAAPWPPSSWPSA